MPVRCIRGATTVACDNKDEILSASKEMLTEIMKQNAVKERDVISVIFTATKDITKVYPAVAARELGLTRAGLCCMQEMYVEGSLPMAIRVMMHVESGIGQEAIKHVYLRGAKRLRPDLSNENFAIALDGPSGAGKSSVARALAERLGFLYIDSGAMYRAAAFFMIERGINPADEKSVLALLDLIELKFSPDGRRIILNGRDVTEAIRVQAVAEGASKVAAIEGVRKKLVSIQRDIASETDVVMDGRDIGTHVLPGAQLKIYMDAGLTIRAERRLSELKDKGVIADLDEIRGEISERDKRDMNREHSPLKKADDAVYLDTSLLTMQEAVDKIIDIYNMRKLP